MKVGTLLDQAASTLIDEDYTRWTLAELVDYYNAGLREIVFYKPSANTITTAVELTTGSKTRYELPASAISLESITRNLGADGLTPGRAIRLVSMQTMNEVSPSWHTATDGITKNYMYNPDDPTVFYVYPPAIAGNYVEAIYYADPTESLLADVGTDDVSLDNQYINPLLDYILFRSFDKDSDIPNSMQNRDIHQARYLSAIMGTIANDPNMDTSPPTRVV